MTRAALAIAAGAWLAGCGQPKPAAPDAATAFAVVAEMPPDGSTLNPPSTTVSATFSAPLDCARVTDASLQVLASGTPIAGRIACADATLSFVPIGAVPTQAMLQAVVDPQVVDSAGRELGTAASWAFGTGPWTRQLGTSGDDVPYGIAVDASGNLYLAGSTTGGLGGNTNAGNNLPDAFVAKLAASGALLWVAQLGTDTADVANAVAVDATGNAYVVGYTGGALAGNASAGGVDAFVAKYGPSGALLWSQQLGTSGHDYATGVAIDAKGNGMIYVAGYTDGVLDGNTSAGLEDMFVAQYDATGARHWLVQYGSSGRDYATSAAVDSSGHVIVAGYTDGGLDTTTNHGYDDLFLVNFDASSSRVWTRQYGTAGYDVARAIATDASGNAIVAGYTNGAAVPGGGMQGYDALVILYQGGVDQWYRQFGTPGDDFAYGIAIDGAGHVDVAGVTAGALDGYANQGATDAFVVQYDTAAALGWARELGTPATDQATCIATDASGNAFVGGKTNGNLDRNTSAGGYDAFVVQVGSDGSER